MVSPKIPYLWVFHFLSPLCSPSNPTFSSYCFSTLYFLSLKPHLLFLMLFYLVFPLPQTSPSLPIAFLPCISSPYNLTFFSYDFTPSQSTMSFFSFCVLSCTSQLPFPIYSIPFPSLSLSFLPFLSLPCFLYSVYCWFLSFFLFHVLKRPSQSSPIYSISFSSFSLPFLSFPPSLSFLYLPYLLLFPYLFLRDSSNHPPPPLSLLLHPFHPYLIIHTSLSMLVHTSFST